MNSPDRAALWLTPALAAAVFAASGGPASAQRTAGATAGSLQVDEANPRIDRSSCVLMLKAPPRVLGIGSNPTVDLNALTTAMTTSGLMDPAAKAALGLGPRQWPKAVRVEVSPVGAQAVKLSVGVDRGPDGAGAPEPAGTLLRELIGRAKAVLAQSIEPRREEAKSRLEEIERRLGEARSSAEALRKRLREAEAASLRGMAVDRGPGLRPQLESELVAKRSRLKAILEILPRFAAQDDLGVAVKGLVAAREALVAALERAVEQGKADPIELLRARVDLAESRVRAAESTRPSGPFAGRNVRDERPGLEVDIASLEAQINALPEKPAEPARPAAEDAQAVRRELSRVEAEVNTLEREHQQARREFDQVASPPSLVVLDGQPG